MFIAIRAINVNPHLSRTVNLCQYNINYSVIPWGNCEAGQAMAWTYDIMYC